MYVFFFPSRIVSSPTTFRIVRVAPQLLSRTLNGQSSKHHFYVTMPGRNILFLCNRGFGLHTLSLSLFCKSLKMKKTEVMVPQTKFEQAEKTPKETEKMIRSLAIAASSALFGVWLLPYDFQLKIRFLKWLTKSPRMSYPLFLSNFFFRSLVDFFTLT